MLKRQMPHSKIVVGGAHPTALPRETMADIPEIDTVFCGEGEYALLDYMEGRQDKVHLNHNHTLC